MRRGKTGVISGAHDMLEQNVAHFGARMACWSKTRQVFVAHDMRRENEGHFGARMACKERNEGHFGRQKSFWGKTHRVSGFKIHFGAKPTGFRALKFILE